ncbi:glycosyltransferase [Paracoccus sediminilitoris]|uniref:glycosyltransferase n=1 Tax=Paracoccus sediminilitoris TaxID=2202419 RepID=UPI000DB90A07|nr:glycosyltransferase [Paracoccus sediminilitoris]
MQMLPIITPSRAVQPAVILSLDIVIPCFNEERRLDIDALLGALDATPGLRLTCVDDGSSDATLSVLQRLAAAAPGRVRVLPLSRNQGKAEAVRQGLLQACTGPDAAHLVGYWDADLSTPLDAIEDFRRVMIRLPEVQMVFGSRRALLGHRIQRSAMRRIISRICATLAGAAIGLSVGDSQCGAKLMRNSDDLRAALARPFDSGWLFDVELFARLSNRWATPREAFFELPLTQWHEVAGSKVTSRAVLSSGLLMLRLIGRNRLAPSRPQGRAA